VWRARYEELGLAGLQDEERPGRPCVYDHDDAGPLPGDTFRRWRSIFVDEIETITITDQPWESPDNNSLETNNIDHIELAV
jgi:hypothetical protein